jgi:hypothetical protein
MNKQEIIERVNALCKEAGLTHDQLAAATYEARDAYLREIRKEHQDKKIIVHFQDGVMLHEIKGRTISEMVEQWPATLRDIIRKVERKDGKLGMLVNSNIPSGWATFAMSK